MKKRTLALLMAAVMLFGVAIGGTVAWLRDDTAPVVNTFTVGNIIIDLNEHDYDPDTNKLNNTVVKKVEDYKMVPGIELPKDPFVTVEKGSEKCWVFVSVTKSNNFDTFMTFSMDDKWEQVETSQDGLTVVYRYSEVVDVSKSENDKTLNVIKGTTVYVKEDVTKTQLESAVNSKPTLTFVAYAVQSENLSDDINTPAEIWNIAKTADETQTQ